MGKSFTLRASDITRYIVSTHHKRMALDTSYNKFKKKEEKILHFIQKVFLLNDVLQKFYFSFDAAEFQQT